MEGPVTTKFQLHTSDRQIVSIPLVSRKFVEIQDESKMQFYKPTNGGGHIIMDLPIC